MKRELKRVVGENLAALKASARNLESIFRILFSHEDLVFSESDSGFRIEKITYGQMRRMCEEASAGLFARIGATHGYVGLEMENCPEWIAAFWAILRSGNKPYLINCRHPRELSAKILKSLDVRYVVGLKPTKLDAEYLDFAELRSPAPFAGEFENEFALSTSATTLHEVVCFYTGAEVTAQLLNTEDVLRRSPEMAWHYHGSLKQLAFLPFYHVFGLFAVYFWFAFFNRTFVFLPDYAPDTILKTCRQHEVTHIFAVPMLWHTIEKKVWRQAKQTGKEKALASGLRFCTALQNVFPHMGLRLSQCIMRSVTAQLFGRSIRFCISGGSYLRDSALALLNGVGYPIHNGFGASETGITSVDLRNRPKYLNRNSIGQPFESVEYRLSDRGTLQIRGSSICSCMMVDGVPAEKQAWFETGDVVEYRDGEYYVRGRAGDIVIGANGENINPDVTEQLLTLPEAEKFSVLGLPSEEGELLTLVIQLNAYLPAKRVRATLDAAIRANENLPSAMRIRRFYCTYDAIAPATAVKVGRGYLLRGIADGSIRLIPFAQIRDGLPETETDFDPDSALARRVRAIIAHELDVTDAQIEADTHVVHDLGADSLHYFALMSAIAEEFPEMSGTDCYTLREFCQSIEGYL